MLTLGTVVDIILKHSMKLGLQLRWLERTPDKGEVAGSSPFRPTIFGKLIELIYMGLQLSWESTCFASRGSGVRSSLAPLIQRLYSLSKIRDLLEIYNLFYFLFYFCIFHILTQNIIKLIFYVQFGVRRLFTLYEIIVVPIFKIKCPSSKSRSWTFYSGMLCGTSLINIY